MPRDGGPLGLVAMRQEEAFSNLIEALRIAESAAKQLAFLRQQKAWLGIEFQIGNVRSLVTQLATSR